MLIKNATMVSWDSSNQILENQALIIENDKISKIGATIDLEAQHRNNEILDARGQLVMPGNICAHTHFYGAFARGMGIPGKAPRDFPEILEKLWWPLDKSLLEDDVRYSALPCLVDAVKHGTTTLIDHHASPNAIDGSLDIIAETVEQAGVRASLCYEVTDRDGPEKMKAGINENIRFIKKEKGSLLAATFGLHACLTLSDSTLAACREATPDGTGFHIHTAESVEDEWDSLNKSGLRVIERLAKFDMLNSNSIAVHGVHFDAREIELLADTGTWNTHQPRSNMNNAVGAAPVEAMLRMGVKVCLGNDGFSNSMWDEWKAAYLMHKLWHRDPRRLGGSDIAQMAIYNNAALANQFFPDAPIGVLKPGAYADIIFVDYHAPTPLTSGNLPWHIIFGFQNSMVTTTIVNGKVLMKDRELQTLDEAEIAIKAREQAKQVWKRYEEKF